MKPRDEPCVVWCQRSAHALVRTTATLVNVLSLSLTGTMTGWYLAKTYEKHLSSLVS